MHNGHWRSYPRCGADDRAAAKADIPLILLDPSAAGNSYYLAYPTRRSQQVSWSDYGSVLFDFGDQVLLRASPRLAEQLPGLGIKIVHMELQPQPWPASVADSRSLLAVTPDPHVQAMLSQVSTDTIYTYTSQLTGAQSATIGGAPYTITRRYTYSGTPIQKAGQFVGEHMQTRGLNVEYQVWGASGTPSTYPIPVPLHRGNRVSFRSPTSTHTSAGREHFTKSAPAYRSAAPIADRAALVDTVIGKGTFGRKRCGG